MKKLPQLLLLAALVAPAVATAQTPKTGTLGGNAAGAAAKKPILTKTELRECMARQAAVEKGTAELDARRAAMDADKAKIESQGEELKAERASLDAQRVKVDELKTRFAAHEERVLAYNTKVKEANPERMNQRERNEIEKERKAIGVTTSELEAERKSVMDVYQPAAEAFNAKAGERDKLVADWNARSVALADDTTKLRNDRDDWAHECAGRRFNEDDEKALKAGK